MKTKRFVRNFHRYLSIFVSIQLLLWTISGIYFAYNKIELIRGEQYRLPKAIEYRIFDRLGTSVIETIESGKKTYKDGINVYVGYMTGDIGSIRSDS